MEKLPVRGLHRLSTETIDYVFAAVIFAGWMTLMTGGVLHTYTGYRLLLEIGMVWTVGGIGLAYLDDWRRGRLP